jgi:hypothetical protein
MQPHSVLEGVGMGMRRRRSTERRMLTTMATTMTMMITISYYKARTVV